MEYYAYQPHYNNHKTMLSPQQLEKSIYVCVSVCMCVQ